MAKKPVRVKNKDNSRRAKKKVSVLTTEKVEYIDYKDVELLQKLVTAQGKMLSRRQISCDARMQHKIKKAMHRARYIGLMPYGP